MFCIKGSMNTLIRISKRITVPSVRWYSDLTTRHANLGMMTNYLTKEGVPNLLQETISDQYLDENIQLRLLPTTYPYIPTINGKVKYKASLNAIRLIVKNFILNDTCRIHISSVKTILAKDKEHSGKGKGDPFVGFVTDNDKLIIKWQTCISNDDCSKIHVTPARINMKPPPPHGNDSSTSHIVEYILDPGKKARCV